MFPRVQSDTDRAKSGSAQATSPASQRVGNQPIFQFDPASLVRGIVFHVVDEGVASEVTDDSVRRTIERLKTRKVSASIERGKWESMSNRQRMDWLLSESKTTTSVVLGRVAVLVPAS